MPAATVTLAPLRAALAALAALALLLLLLLLLHLQSPLLGLVELGLVELGLVEQLPLLLKSLPN